MGSIANTFGTSKIQVRFVDPAPLHRVRGRFSRPLVRKLALTNSLYVPFGERRARGFILLRRADYDTIRSYGSQFQMTLQAASAQAPITFYNLSIVTADCISTGLLESSDAVYLVELTDGRGILESPWFSFPANSYYNVLAPAYPGTYYAASLDSGSVWTWTRMAEDLWNQQAQFLGTYPGLPTSPAGTPTNWNLPGVSAWKSLSRALYLLGLGVQADLTQTSNPYAIVESGGTDSVFAALAAANPAVEEDLDPIDIGAGRVPGMVVVYFRKVYQYYGTEETVRSDSNQWATRAVYSVAQAAPAFFQGASGTGHLWDDFVVRCDIDGVPLPADIVTAATIAGERVRQFFDDIYSRTLGRMDRTYAGLVPFRAGAEIDGVRWYEDFSQGRGGWRTQVVRGWLPEIWPQVYGDQDDAKFG